MQQNEPAKELYPELLNDSTDAANQFQFYFAIAENQFLSSSPPVFGSEIVIIIDDNHFFKG
jgi:hypothetical protein